MSNYLKKAQTIHANLNLRDYSLSNNNIDDDYAATLKGISIPQMLKLINKYPDHNYSELKRVVKQNFGASNIILGSGSEDLIIRTNFTLRKRGGIGICLPNFYRVMETAGNCIKIYTPYDLDSNKIKLEKISEQINKKSNKIKSLWISNPNPMIGKMCEKNELVKIVKNHRKILFIVDEAAIDFIKNNEEYSVIDLAQEVDNLIVIRSFSKLYGIAGLRVGFATGNTKILKKIKEMGPTFSVNGVAEYFLKTLLKKRRIIEKIRGKIDRHKTLLEDLLFKNENIILSNTVTNCLFFGHKNKKIFSELLKLGVLALNLNNQEGIKEKNFVRVTIHSSTPLFNNLFSKFSELIKKV